MIDTAVLITGEDFDRAISEVLHNNLTDPRHLEHPEGALAFSLGGAVFAREVKEILFRGEEKPNE
jgi:hypothetical protein